MTLTSVENIALNLIFESVNECRFNRSTTEYLAIAERLPPVKVLVDVVNRRLREHAANPPFELICRFVAGDLTPRYDPYPQSVSATTIRNALNKSGMRVRRRRSNLEL